MKKRAIITMLMAMTALMTVSGTAYAVEPVSSDKTVEEITQTTEINLFTEQTTESPTDEPAPLPQLSVEKRTMGVGERCDLADFLIEGLDVTKFTYKTDSSDIVSVDTETNQVAALNSGTAVVYVSNTDGVTKSFTITVKPAPTQVYLNKTSITLGVGETFDLNSSFKNGEGAYRIDYTTDNSYIADVAWSGGLVTAKRAGTATVTATTYNGKEVICTVTVKNAPTELYLNKTSITLGVGETFDLNSSLKNGEGAYSIKYSSNNSRIADVKSSGGLVTAKNVGTATITATAYNGKKVDCIVTVKSAPSSVSLNKTKITLGVGETFDLNSSLPKGTAAYSIKYSSNNTTIADVKSSGGLVTAKNVGTATITATTYNGKKVNCTVTVKPAPTAIYLNKSIVVVTVGETYDLNSSFKNGQGAYLVKYSSQNPSIATVKAGGGLVTGKKIGTTIVTATTYNGKKVNCTVVVAAKKNVATVKGSVIKNKAAWSGSTLKSFSAGTKMNQISKSGNWIKVECNGTIGYVYNRAFNDKANYSTISESTLPAYVDDWFFNNGTSIQSIYNFSRSMGYRSMNEGSSIESMSVYILKYRNGACYQRAAILYYMLDRAGYEVKYVKGIDDYTGGSPHRWCMIKTSSGWRHIDPTPVIGLPNFYLVKDSAIAPYFSWSRSEYPAAR